MAVLDLGQDVTAVAIAATASTTTAPTGGTDGFLVSTSGGVRTLIAYTATVSSANLRLWIRDRETGVWYGGATTDSLSALAPGGASVVNEARDWYVGAGSEVFFQLAAVAGGGTVAVRVQGVG